MSESLPPTRRSTPALGPQALLPALRGSDSAHHCQYQLTRPHPGLDPTHQQAKTSIEIPQTLYTVSWKLVSLTSRLTLTQDTQACNQPPKTMFSDTTWPSGGRGGSPRHRTFYGSTESRLMTKPCQPVARSLCTKQGQANTQIGGFRLETSNAFQKVNSS